MSEDDQTRVATVQVTNAADTDELQTLITLLENRFTVDVRMQDGEMRVLRDSPDSSDTTDEDETPTPDDHRNIDELMESMRKAIRDAAEGNTVSDSEELRERIAALRDADEEDSVSLSEEFEGLNGREVIEKLRQSDRDIAEGRTSTLDEVREDLDGDETDDAEKSEQSAASAESPEDESDAEEDDRPTCQYCGDDFHPKGVKNHERHCPENPDNQDETDSEKYRCGNCEKEFSRERSVQSHQNRSRDCTGRTSNGWSRRTTAILLRPLPIHLATTMRETTQRTMPTSIRAWVRSRLIRIRWTRPWSKTMMMSRSRPMHRTSHTTSTGCGANPQPSAT